MNISVTLLNGEKISQTFTASEVTIGRGQKADFIIINDSLSRLHAKIEIINHEFFITDLESSNGVFLDGKRITANQRTPFSTFLVLQLGPIDCQVTEASEDNGIIYGQTPKVSTSEGIEELSKPTKTNRNINRVALNSSLPDLKKENIGRTRFPVIVAVALGLCGLVYYQLSTKPSPSSVPQNLASSTVSQQAGQVVVLEEKEATRVIKRDFLTYEEYDAIRVKASCKQHFEICHTMEMTEDEGEGILIEGKEAFIFLSPTRKKKNFSALADKTDALEIIALSSFLSSLPYASLKNKELEQIHLIIQNDEFRMVNVFRFNANEYSENDLILSGMRDAIFTGNTSSFWQAINAQVKSKTF
jgi:hypothetical protein